MPRWLGVLALLSGGASLAVAQSPNDFIRMFDIPQDAIVQAATRSEWSKLSSTEIGCMDDALHQQGGSVEALIERGVMPFDPRIGGTRSNCRSQLAQRSPSVPVYRGFNSIVRLTESTNAVRAINSTDLHGVRKPAKTGNGGALSMRPTQFCTRVTERLFMSTAIKSRLSSARPKPPTTFNGIRARSASRHE